MARRSPQTERLVEVIEYLAAQPGTAHSLADLARQLDVDKATCYPMLVELTRLGWLLKDPVAKTYRLGPRLSEIGIAAGRSIDAITAVRPYVTDLADDCDCTCCVILPSGDDLVVADIARPPASDRPPIVDLVVGDRVAFRPPLGAVLVSGASQLAVDQWLDRAPETISRDDYRDILALIDRRGFAVEQYPVADSVLWDKAQSAGRGLFGASRTSDIVEGQRREITSDLLVGPIHPDHDYRPLSISAAIRDGTSTVIGAISILDPPAPMTGEQVCALGDRVRSAASTAGTQIAGRNARPSTS